MRGHELRLRKEMPCNTLKQKDVERAELQSLLDEWLGQGNEVKVMPPCATLEAIKEMTGRERMNIVHGIMFGGNGRQHLGKGL